MEKLYVVVYRLSGDRDNFMWNRTHGNTKERTEECARIIRIQPGTAAYVVDEQRSLNIGLPETFEAGA